MMNSMNEPRRWWTRGQYDNDTEVVSAKYHDRIVAEHDELWKRATKFVMPGEMDTGESIEHYIKTLEQTIARQAKVIEKLKGMVSHYETCATVDRYDDEKVPCDCGLEKELAAIEKEGAKDE